MFQSLRFLTVGAIAGAALALGACEPAEPPVLAADREPAAALVAPPPRPTAAPADTQLRELIEETFALIEQYLPKFDTSAARAVFDERRVIEEQ